MSGLDIRDMRVSMFETGAQEEKIPYSSSVESCRKDCSGRMTTVNSNPMLPIRRRASMFHVNYLWDHGQQAFEYVQGPEPTS